jgi:hypothetical protein
MKKIIILSCVLALLVSCKKASTESESKVETSSISEPITEESTKEESTTEESTLENSENTSTGSEDYDKMLDDYEEYVIQYGKLYKKAIKGDASAMAEYPALMEKATEFQKSMEEAQGNDQLSMNQITRMSEIQTKMLKAMQ